VKPGINMQILHTRCSDGGPRGRADAGAQLLPVAVPGGRAPRRAGAGVRARLPRAAARAGRVRRPDGPAAGHPRAQQPRLLRPPAPQGPGGPHGRSGGAKPIWSLCETWRKTSRRLSDHRQPDPTAPRGRRLRRGDGDGLELFVEHYR